MTPRPRSVTRIARHTADAVFVREKNLVEELIGQVTFTEMMFLQLMGERPDRLQVAVLDAVLVTLMEHGFTPSSIVSRLIYDSVPEAMQSAVAAGLLGVGGTFIGTMEGASVLIEDILTADEGIPIRARMIAEDHLAQRKPLPGFGHPFHRPDDPRSPKLFDIAQREGARGEHIRALQALSAAVDKAYGRHLTINVTGAVAAVLGEIGIPSKIMRGLAVVSRCAGLVGHIHEEQQIPTARTIWDLTSKNIPYEVNP